MTIELFAEGLAPLTLPVRSGVLRDRCGNAVAAFERRGDEIHWADARDVPDLGRMLARLGAGSPPAVRRAQGD